MINRQRLYERFVQYVRIGTTANPDTEIYPSSPGQLELGKLLVEQMEYMGISDAHQDKHGLVWGTIPASVDGPVPTVLLNAHLDTSPDAPGEHVEPQVVEAFDGTEVVLLNGERIDPVNTPALANLVGHTLITTDGKTLLGGDDKAGVAAIMELAHHLIENPHLPHGPVRLLFTCDEEIGRGTRHFDTAKADARIGYTLDGGGAGTIDVETFSADAATVRFFGRSSHPSEAKGRMLNSIRAVNRFLALLPSDRLTPETTEGREGFIHPHTLHGAVGETVVQMILRDFDTSKLSDQAALIRAAVEQVEREFPGLRAEVETKKQYRNMGDVLAQFPASITLAEKAFESLGRTCKRDSVRGGTDGALISELGIPCPNLSVGQYNIHSVREFVSLNQMEEAVEHLIALVDLWQQFGRS